MRKIQVVIAEDQAMVLGALAALLETESDIAVVGRARNGREALSAVARHAPDGNFPLGSLIPGEGDLELRSASAADAS